MQSGGIILKREAGDDTVFMAGDLVDPVTLIGTRHSGDLLTIGSTTLLAGNREELREHLVTGCERLRRAFYSVTRDMVPADRTKSKGITEYLEQLTGFKQHWLEAYPPLLFGEKSLYRKGIKLLERRDYIEAESVLKLYLDQFVNSPLARPAKLYYAVACLLNERIDTALDLSLEIFAEEKGELASIARRLISYLGLFETSYRILHRSPGYSAELFRNLVIAFGDRIVETDSELVLFEEGRKIEGVAVLVEGQIKCFKNSSKKPSLVFTLNPPDSIGEILSTVGSLCDVTIVAAENSKLFIIERDAFFDYIIRKFPCEGFKLMEYFLRFSEELRDL